MKVFATVKSPLFRGSPFLQIFGAAGRIWHWPLSPWELQLGATELRHIQNSCDHCNGSFLPNIWHTQVAKDSLKRRRCHKSQGWRYNYMLLFFPHVFWFKIVPVGPLFDCWTTWSGCFCGPEAVKSLEAPKWQLWWISLWPWIWKLELYLQRKFWHTLLTCPDYPLSTCLWRRSFHVWILGYLGYVRRLGYMYYLEDPSRSHVLRWAVSTASCRPPRSIRTCLFSARHEMARHSWGFPTPPKQSIVYYIYVGQSLHPSSFHSAIHIASVTSLNKNGIHQLSALLSAKKWDSTIREEQGEGQDLFELNPGLHELNHPSKWQTGHMTLTLH